MEVVRTQDAAVAKATGLTAGGELDQAGGVGAGTTKLHAERHHFFAGNDVTVRCCHIPDTPRNSFHDFLDV